MACVAGMLIGCVMAMQATVVTYIPDNTTVFRNPERGFTEEESAKVSVSNPNVVKGNIDAGWGASDRMSLMVVLYNFYNFKNKDLPQEVLTGFDEDMQELRNYGLKCVLRFAYTESQSDKKDAKPEWVKRHLEQLGPHLKANADVIYVLEAGFIGSWGEWYYTENYGNESQHMNDNRRKVVDYLFANAPQDRFILFRYPMIKTEYLNDTASLTYAEGFSGTVKARMGCHNDAFLNKYGNDGTYASDDKEDDPKVRQYVANETMYVPNGGETNVESNSLAKKVYTQAPEEMSRYHWSFCGSSYATPVTDRWRESGLFDTLNIHMGYRYNLLHAQFSDEAVPGGEMQVTIRLQNVGYAPLYNERTVWLVLKGTQEYKIPLQTDPRRWLPNGEKSTVNEQVSLPTDMPEGTFHLYLWLPDKYESIASDPRYAVRLANANMWDETTGWNDLQADVTVSRNATGIQETRSEQTRPQKRIENGILYIQMPDGRKISSYGQTISY